jgi:protoheme IX farnesyltransferase
MGPQLRIILELAKIRIAVLSMLSVFAGYVLAAGTVNLGVVAPLVGVFFLACGAAALNQYQERDIDAKMDRTKKRPLPSGRITPGNALRTAFALMLLGSLVLLPHWSAIGLGWLTVLWYNALYTPLKRVTAFAAVPGGVVGALPPAIGWVCGGGDLLDPRIFAVSFFFFIWQIPHFWMLLMRVGGDYQQAGLPSLSAVFSRRQLSRVTFIWMLTTAVVCLVFPLFGVVSETWIFVGFVLAAVWLSWHAVAMLRTQGERLAFKEINVFALLVISLLSISGLRG